MRPRHVTYNVMLLEGVNSSEVPMSDVKESGAGVKESMKEKDEPFTEQRSKCCSLS